MKLGILGDIHGNSHALEAVLDSANSHGVEKLLVTGDLVGYYYMPSEVMQLLAPWQKYIVRGNHEDMLAKAIENPSELVEIEKRYGSAIQVALETLSQDQLDTLCNLPHPLNIEIGGMKILLSHGAPWDNDFYVYPDAETDILTKCASQDFDIVIMGHTHYPMLKKLGKTQVVNPGSVGQPRNHKPGAQWAMLDTVTAEVTFYNEFYDVEPLLAEIKLRNPELPYLANVLIRK